MKQDNIREMKKGRVEEAGYGCWNACGILEWAYMAVDR